jgi:glycyl-tRNA synthetase alpha subunit
MALHKIEMDTIMRLTQNREKANMSCDLLTQFETSLTHKNFQKTDTEPRELLYDRIRSNAYQNIIYYYHTLITIDNKKLIPTMDTESREKLKTETLNTAEKIANILKYA